MTNRVARVQGVTNVLHLYHTKQIEKQTVIRYIVKNYCSNNYMINGTFYTIQELSQALRTPESILQAYINEYYTNWSNTNQDDQLGLLARASLKSALFGSLESAQMALEQLSTLRFSQNGQYQPFISKEVNSALKNHMDAWKTVAELAEKLKPKAPSINILNQGGNAAIVHAQIGTTEALKLVEEKVKAMENFQLGSPGHMAYLASKSLQSEDIPNVVATEAQEQEIMAQLAKQKALEEEELGSRADLKKAKNLANSIVDDITEEAIIEP